MSTRRCVCRVCDPPMGRLATPNLSLLRHVFDEAILQANLHAVESPNCSGMAQELIANLGWAWTLIQRDVAQPEIWPRRLTDAERAATPEGKI